MGEAFSVWNVGDNLRNIRWLAVIEQWPTILSLALFTIILVPIRIPSLSLVTGDEGNGPQMLSNALI